MDKNTEKQIFQLLDQHRSEHKISLPLILKLAQNNNIDLSYNDIFKLSQRLSKGGPFLTPKFVIDAICEITKQLKHKNILDPFAGFGSLLSPVSQNLNFDRTYAIEKNSDTFETGKWLDKSKNSTWFNGDTLSILDEIPGNFDLIVSRPPWGVKPLIKSSIAFGTEEIEVADDLENFAVLKSCLKLSKDGLGIFVLAPSFFLNSRGKSVNNQLSKFNLQVDTILHLPSGTFAPSTNLDGYLTIIRHGKQAPIFIAELTENIKHNNTVLYNYKNRTDTGKISIGRIIEKKNFTFYQSLVENEKIERLAKKMDVATVSLDSVAKEINTVRQGEKFTEKDNAIYIPLVGMRPATSILDELPKNHMHYTQIVFDKAKVYGEYAAHFYNTPLAVCRRKIFEILVFILGYDAFYENIQTLQS